MTIFAIYWLGVSGICLYADGRDDPNGWLMIAFAWPIIPVVTVVAVVTSWSKKLWSRW